MGVAARLKSWGPTLAYAAFLATVVALGVEVTVRLLGLAPPLNLQYPGMVPDPHLPYRPAPGSAWEVPADSGEFAFEVRHSSWGLRDTEHSIAKSPRTFRILGLGDSFTYGVGAAHEDTYLVRLERLLAQRDGAHLPVEVIKAGIPRFFPVPERLLLEHYGLSLDPDLVVVGFVPNDVSDTSLGLEAVTRTDDGYLMSREATELGRCGRWLFLHLSAARMVLKGRLDRRLRVRHPEPWTDIYRPDGQHEGSWQRVEEEYSRMVELASTSGAKLVVLHIPERGPWGPGADYPPARLSAWAASRGAFLVDALPALREADARGEKLYWDADPHCTAAGYRVVAEVLAAGLVERGLAP